MSKEKTMKVWNDGVKLIVLLQASLEQMDELKGTSLYRQSLKRKINDLEKSVESAIRRPLAALDGQDDELLSAIQYKVEMILSMSLEELAGLKMAVEEHRESEIANRELNSQGV